MEITCEEQNKVKRMKRTEDSLRDLWDNIKCTNTQIIGVPEEEEKKKGHKKIFEEIIIENFPNMEKEIVNQVQEAQRVPYRINPRRNMPRYILIIQDIISLVFLGLSCMGLFVPPGLDCLFPFPRWGNFQL